MEKKLYQKPWFIWLAIIFFFPVGLYLMWKHTGYSKQVKVVITVVVLVIAVFAAMDQQEKKEKAMEKAMEKAEVDRQAFAVQQQERQKERATKVDPPKSQPPSDPTKGVENRLRNISGVKIDSVKWNKPFGNDDYYVVVIIQGKDNLTSNMIRRGAIGDSAEVFRELYSTSLPIEAVDVITNMELVSQTGQKQETKILSLTLDKETAAKVDWKNLDLIKFDFDKVTKDNFIHPAIR